MSRVIAGAILGVLFVITLLATAPARLLGEFIPAQQLVLQGYSGTLWRGAANRALLATGPGYLHLGKIRWSLSPFSLLTLSPALHLDSVWGKQRISTDLRLRGAQSVELHKLDAVFSSQLLRQFLPLAIAGDISIQFAHLQVDKGLLAAAEGRIVWREGAWKSNRGILPLGSYAIDIQQNAEGVISGDIVTLSGEVRASGRLGLKGQDYSVDVLVSTGSVADEQLQQALSLIAQPVPQGYRIKFDGQLSTL